MPRQLDYLDNLRSNRPSARKPTHGAGVASLAGEHYYGRRGTLLRGSGNVTTGIGERYYGRRGARIVRITMKFATQNDGKPATDYDFKTASENSQNLHLLRPRKQRVRS
jgi:hypothetical protein